MIKTVLISLLGVGFFLIFSLVLAQEAAPNRAPNPSPVEYILPYPGILPDHLLYFVKSLRDFVLLTLITNPKRKVEFRILTADKRLNMAMFLLDENKHELAAKTTTETVEFLRQAEEELTQIPPGNTGEVANLKEQLTKSILKHEEVLIILKNRTTGASREHIEQALTDLQKLQHDFSLKK